MSREQIRPEIARLDLFILGGGGILFDAEVGVYLREVMLAHEAMVPVLVYATSAGPLERPESRTAVKGMASVPESRAESTWPQALSA